MNRNNIFWWRFLSSLCLFSFGTASKWLDIHASHPSGTIVKFTDGPAVDVLYLIHPSPILSINLDASVSANTSFYPLPATSIHVDTPRITKRFLRSYLNEFSIDDVWNRSFLKSVILCYDGQTPATIDDQANIWLRNQGVTTLFLLGSIEWPAREAVPTYKLSESNKVDVGPIVIFRLDIGEETHLAFHNVYRLYVDEYESFLFGAIPNLINGGWILTNFIATDSDEVALQLIPVPSRFNSLPAPHFPLAGMRFGLKDIYHARGLPTAAGSIAYQLTHDIPEETAPSIQMLLDLGAVIVGKTRTSQFAHGANPWEFVDVPYSWNPRADGYLTASASSSGSACAIAAYEWLDFTIGSMDLTGVVPLSEEMDTAGFFARDPQLFYEIASEWFVWAASLFCSLTNLIVQVYRFSCG